MGDYMSMQGESSLKFDAPEQRRRYQTRCLAEDENKKKGCLIQFAPSGEDTQCFLTLISRINGAEIRPGLMFPMYVWGVGINLYGANLYGANLERAYLYRAYLKGAYVYRAYLKEANLYGANLKEANLKGANLKGARYLTVEQVQEAKNWKRADYDEQMREKLGLT